MPNYEAPPPNHSNHLRASGNLTYLDFIRVVQQIWSEAHPDIPLIATGTATAGSYPCIVYSLDLRRTHPVEPKPRYREAINTGKMLISEDGEILRTQEGLIIYGQRFQNVVKFTVLDKVDSDGAQNAEEIIEVFEDFMHEYTAAFKFLGASELTYNRRHPDDEDPRKGEGIVARTVSYMLTTERITQMSIGKIQRIASTIRIGYPEDQATPTNPSPYEPNYEADLADPNAGLYNGIFDRPQIIDDNRTVDPDD